MALGDVMEYAPTGSTNALDVTVWHPFVGLFHFLANSIVITKIVALLAQFEGWSFVEFRETDYGGIFYFRHGSLVLMVAFTAIAPLIIRILNIVGVVVLGWSVFNTVTSALEVKKEETKAETTKTILESPELTAEQKANLVQQVQSAPMPSGDLTATMQTLTVAIPVILGLAVTGYVIQAVEPLIPRRRER